MRILSPSVRPKRVHREECIVPNVSVTSHDAPVVSLQLTDPQGLLGQFKQLLGAGTLGGPDFFELA